MVMVKTCASSACAGVPAIDQQEGAEGGSGENAQSRSGHGTHGSSLFAQITSLRHWLGGCRLRGDQLGDQGLVLGSQSGVVERDRHCGHEDGARRIGLVAEGLQRDGCLVEITGLCSGLHAAQLDDEACRGTPGRLEQRLLPAPRGSEGPKCSCISRISLAMVPTPRLITAVMLGNGAVERPAEGQELVDLGLGEAFSKGCSASPTAWR